MTTNIAEFLAEQKSLAEAATEGPWLIDSIESGEHGLFVDEDNPEDGQSGAAGSTVASFLLGKNAEFIAAARESVPRMIAALEAVLEMHVEGEWRCGNPRHANPEVGCPECYTECEACGRVFPCDTVRAIDTALIGGEGE